MSEIPQAFRDAIETEWRHDDKMNADILTIGLRATAKTACRHEDAEKFKDFIEEHMVSELYKLVSGLVGEAEETAKLRELVKEMYCVISENNSWWDFRCDETKAFHQQLQELGIEVGE